MSDLEEELARLRRFNRALDSKQTITDEETEFPEVAVSGVKKKDIPKAIENETIVLRQKRPVLAIQADKAQLVFDDPKDKKIWEAPLKKAREMLARASRAVGRIELNGHHKFDWVGTGWLVAPEILVTNRHVAETFAGGSPLSFTTGPNGPLSAGIDFLQEIDSKATRRFEIEEPLHVESSDGPDLAFFKVRTKDDDGLAEPIEFADRMPDGPRSVVVIGYPARDLRIPDWKLMDRIYGDVYEKKRLAPGEITRTEAKRVFHNCTTLGGNSGSVVLDLSTGKALGLHYSGSFLVSNYAVPADVVKRRVDDLLRGRLRERSAPSPRSRGPRPADTAPGATTQGGSVTVEIPLRVTVSLGDSRAQRILPQQRSVSRRAPAVEDLVEVNEAVAADYEDRGGYVASFLGKKSAVKLPTILDADDVLDVEGDDHGELRYEHFSVKLSRRRRMCIFSAVNISGEDSKKTKRAGWRLDPRVPEDAQIIKECYGRTPLFSRGHMTRREDPAWGDKKTAHRGNVDSMHVTNAVPQMQAFNSPIWLGLEDFALQNAREDDMKISVFTGPYFDYRGQKDRPVKGVLIPRAFWKVIVFIHDKTKKLCATGYEMSQEQNLPEEEFIFGDYFSSQLNRSTQVPIATIEARAGLRFDGLTKIDPLRDVEEGPTGMEPLETFEQIQFV